VYIIIGVLVKSYTIYRLPTHSSDCYSHIDPYANKNSYVVVEVVVVVVVVDVVVVVVVVFLVVVVVVVVVVVTTFTGQFHLLNATPWVPLQTLFLSAKENILLSLSSTGVLHIV